MREIFKFIALCWHVACNVAEKPHVVIILADDLGYNDMPWNNPDVIAPNLLKLANSGTIMNNFYVQPVCTPSRSALMTSRYPIRFGLQTDVITAPQPSCLPLDEMTFGNEMKLAGYRTHAVGKWHLGHYCPQCLPQNRGFDTFYGYLTGAEDYYKKTFCIRIHNNEDFKCGYDFYSNMNRDYSANGTYSTYQFRQAAQNLISDHVKSYADQQMFMYLPFQSVHYPVMVPKIYYDLYPDVADHTRRTYLGMVTAMDEAIGGIIEELKTNGMYDNTAFFFTSDNGGLVGAGGRNAPFRGQKATLWQGGLKVPAFISGPNIQQGSTYSNIMHISDIQMTILDMINHKRVGRKPVDGVSHWNQFKFDGRNTQISKKLNVDSKPREEILLNIDYYYDRGYSPDPLNFTNYPNPFFNTSIHSGIISLYNGMYWKLLTGDPGCSLFDKPCRSSTPLPNPFPSVRLYNLDTDETEENNVYDKFPDVVMALLKKLHIYDLNSYPTFYPVRDPAADPALHDGWWGPWKEKPNNWPRVPGDQYFGSENTL